MFKHIIRHLIKLRRRQLLIIIMKLLLPLLITQTLACEFRNEQHEFIFEHGCLTPNENWDGTTFKNIRCIGWDKVQSKSCPNYWSRQPSKSPTDSPSSNPTDAPSVTPSTTPTSSPSLRPSSSPSSFPSDYPSSYPSTIPTYVDYIAFDCNGTQI